jgi:hypothetical protein
MTAGTPDNPADPGGRWPEPGPGQVEVLVLGFVHTTDPKFDDTLTPERQHELRALVDRLASWRPDGVAVELPDEHQESVDSLYGEYRSGERAYDETSAFEPFSPYVDDPLRECRGEPVQVGFRLADRLDHDRVHAVDYPMTFSAHLTDEEDAAIDWEGIQTARSELDVSVPKPDSGDVREQRWEESTVVEYLRWLHREENVRRNEQNHFAMMLAGPDEQYVGSRMLTAWYERNLRIVENLWRAVNHDTDRLTLVIGHGHVHILRTMLSDAPPFCPVNPRPVLDG